tara:strand:- start:1253 stop:2572 length:1320 start_codon:yes stop_codon:yes gene_type:complete
MSCSWDSIISTLDDGDLNILKLTSRPPPDEMIQVLSRLNKKTVNVKWQNISPHENDLKRNFNEIYYIASRDKTDAYYCSDFDPVLFLLSEILHINICMSSSYNYIDKKTCYTISNPIKTVYFKLYKGNLVNSGTYYSDDPLTCKDELYFYKKIDDINSRLHVPKKNPPPVSSTPFTPTKNYKIIYIEGWKIYVHSNIFIKNDAIETKDVNAPKSYICSDATMYEIGQEAIRVLQWQLYFTKRVVAETPLEKLQQVSIWLELPDKPLYNSGGAVYHWNKEWLIINSLNPNKSRSIEFTDVRLLVFNGMTYQPTIILHELAHAFHDQVLTHAHTGIETAYKAAMESGIYKSVMCIQTAIKGKHYACYNKYEYFACASSAYFGQSDYYPFVNVELKSFDPKCYELMTAIWGERRRGIDFERGEQRERCAKITYTTLEQYVNR